MNKFGRRELDALKKANKIVDYTISPKGPVIPGVKKADHESKAKNFIAWNLPYWCRTIGVILETEYEFHPTRKWRFDWCIPEMMLAIEFEGGIGMVNGAHSSREGIKRDIEKYNAATAMGYQVVRFNSTNYKTLIPKMTRYAEQKNLIA